MMPETVQKTVVQFNEVYSTGVFMAEAKANNADFMALLLKKGLRPMTYQEAFLFMDKNSEAKEQLKGKWFYLEGKGLEEPEYCTFDDEGKLAKL
jgi:hypothetical protein